MRVATFHLFIRMLLIKDRTQRSDQTAKLQVATLAHNVWANNWPHLYTANGLTIGSDKVKQFLSEVVSLRVKASWNLLHPERLYPKYKSRSHIFYTY